MYRLVVPVVRHHRCTAGHRHFRR